MGLKGDLIRRLRKEEYKLIFDKILKLKNEAEELRINFVNLMAANSGKYLCQYTKFSLTENTKEKLKEKGIEHKIPDTIEERIEGITEFQYRLATGGSYKTTIRNEFEFQKKCKKQIEDFNRIKYYISLKHGDGILKEAQDFFYDLCIKCKESDILICWKSQDHCYDALIIYITGSRKRDFEFIMKELYEKYEKIFNNSCHRILQGKIENIKPEHISWVNEPSRVVINQYGMFNGSHTNRMVQLGSHLAQKGFTIDNYLEACKQVNIDPKKPWVRKIYT